MTPIARFRSKLFGTVLFTALSLATSGSRVEATALDPSHLAWSDPAIDGQAWAEALMALRVLNGDAKHLLRPQSVIDGLARSTAVGVRVLVVPVLPSDAPVVPVSREELEQRWFGPGEGSVRGYWNSVSGGQFELSGRVLPWLQVEGSLGQDYLNVLNGNSTNLAAGPRNLARDGLAAAARRVLDLRVFDDDGTDGVPGSGDDDGILDLVVILHPWAGWEVDPTAVGPAIASVQTRLFAESIEGTSVLLDAFVVTSATAPLGVWAHEFGHLLGLEDLYDFGQTQDRNLGGADVLLGGLGRWSLMASGTWGAGGTRPAGLDAWSRGRLGWGTAQGFEDANQFDLLPFSPNSSMSVTLRPTGDWGDEFFLLENRALREGQIVDGDLPGSGVLILRVIEDAGPINGSSAWIQLLQADGDDDLGAGLNDGDATDVYDGGLGRDLLGATTNPSSAPPSPAGDRVAPRIEIDAADASGAHRIRFVPVEGSRLELVSATFPQEFEEGRTFLRSGLSGTWLLEFEEKGATLATSASVDVEILASGRPASIDLSGARELEARGTTWTLIDPVTITDESVLLDPRAIDVRLTIATDQSPSRVVEFSIPVLTAPGLDGNLALDQFVPRLIAASGDTTRFELLSITELPRTTSAGWGTKTLGQTGYADNVELALEGPWTALGTGLDLEFWSRQEVETSLPGMAWDAGVVEVFSPERGWRTLEPEGPDVVQVWRQSAAGVRDRVGLGGDAWLWQPYRVTLPAHPLPIRVRFRFASDGDDPGGQGWQIAGATTLVPIASATIGIRERGGGGLEAQAQLDGDFEDIDQVRYRYREPGVVEWELASQLFTPRTDAATSVEIVVPSAIDVFELGLFAELPLGGGGGSTPPLLLGTTGYRRSASIALPRLLANPAIGRIEFDLPVRSEPLLLRVYDVRGRRVASFRIPAGVAFFQWDGTGESGRRLGSGRYFLALDGVPGSVVDFVWIR